MKNISSFTDLTAWKEGHQLVLSVYKLTGQFPVDERFGLTSQLRRAAVSITSNIAEGFSRNTVKDKKQFYTVSLCSLREVQNQLLISRDLQYIHRYVFMEIANKSVAIAKLINGLKRSAQSN